MQPIACPGCRSPLDVPPDQLGFWIKCPLCKTGFAAMSDEPAERPRYSYDAYAYEVAPPTGVVSLVTVVTCTLALLSFACGALLLGSGFILAIETSDRSKASGIELLATWGGMAGVFLVVLAAVQLLISLPLFAAAYGLSLRKEWGRILTLMLGGFSGVLALVSALNLAFLAAPIYGAYFVTVYVILLQARYAAEFR